MTEAAPAPGVEMLRAVEEDMFDPANSPGKTSDGSPRRVLLKRPLMTVPSTSEIPSEDSARLEQTSERRKVLLAHKIKPGQTIQLKASKATATMRDDPDTHTDIHAESLVHATSRPIGPQYGAEGNLLSFSVLGPVEEFAEQSEALIGGPPAMAGTSTLAEHAPIGATATHVFDRLDDSFENARLKNDSASARQRQSEALAEQQVRTWQHQISTLADRLGVPQSSLQMARTAEYRGRVQQREVLEALRRRQHPYGGDRAWQIGLRSGGVFYEAIGNASNGIFCPFRAPNDVEALARAGTLAAQIDENDLT